jgi:geranylgeranylglycerol-phosphate geranylgeranyltransferase
VVENIDTGSAPEGEMPHRDRRRWRVLDERSDVGGRAKAWLFLTHPGPSLLVTALVVAAAALLTRQAPSVRIAAGLVLAMLPCQLAIGALNDWADVALDSVAKPYKPIPRGLVRRGGALAFAIVGFTVSVGAAAWLGPGVLGVDALGVTAGVSYDLALKRTPFAVLAWWPGFLVVPLIAMVATGKLQGAAAAVPLTGLLAVAVQIANGLPDIEGDRLGGANTLPAHLGVTRSRWLMGLALGVAAVYVAALRGPLGQSALALAGAGLLAVAALIPLLPRGAPRLAFPLLAVLAAGGTVSWLAALPTPAPG